MLTGRKEKKSTKMIIGRVPVEVLEEQRATLLKKETEFDLDNRVTNYETVTPELHRLRCLGNSFIRQWDMQPASVSVSTDDDAGAAFTTLNLRNTSASKKGGKGTLKDLVNADLDKWRKSSARGGKGGDDSSPFAGFDLQDAASPPPTSRSEPKEYTELELKHNPTLRRLQTVLQRIQMAGAIYSDIISKMTRQPRSDAERVQFLVQLEQAKAVLFVGRRFNLVSRIEAIIAGAEEAQSKGLPFLFPEVEAMNRSQDFGLPLEPKTPSVLNFRKIEKKVYDEQYNFLFNNKDLQDDDFQAAALRQLTERIGEEEEVLEAAVHPDVLDRLKRPPWDITLSESNFKEICWLIESVDFAMTMDSVDVPVPAAPPRQAAYRAEEPEAVAAADANGAAAVGDHPTPLAIKRGDAKSVPESLSPQEISAGVAGSVSSSIPSSRRKKKTSGLEAEEDHTFMTSGMGLNLSRSDRAQRASTTSKDKDEIERDEPSLVAFSLNLDAVLPEVTVSPTAGRQKLLLKQQRQLGRNLLGFMFDAIPVDAYTTLSPVEDETPADMPSSTATRSSMASPPLNIQSKSPSPRLAASFTLSAPSPSLHTSKPPSELSVDDESEAGGNHDDVLQVFKLATEEKKVRRLLQLRPDLLVSLQKLYKLYNYSALIEDVKSGNRTGKRRTEEEWIADIEEKLKRRKSHTDGEDEEDELGLTNMGGPAHSRSKLGGTTTVTKPEHSVSSDPDLGIRISQSSALSHEPQVEDVVDHDHKEEIMEEEGVDVLHTETTSCGLEFTVMGVLSAEDAARRMGGMLVVDKKHPLIYEQVIVVAKNTRDEYVQASIQVLQNKLKHLKVTKGLKPDEPSGVKANIPPNQSRQVLVLEPTKQPKKKKEAATCDGAFVFTGRTASSAREMGIEIGPTSDDERYESIPPVVSDLSHARTPDQWGVDSNLPTHNAILNNMNALSALQMGKGTGYVHPAVSAALGLGKPKEGGGKKKKKEKGGKEDSDDSKSASKTSAASSKKFGRRDFPRSYNALGMGGDKSTDDVVSDGLPSGVHEGGYPGYSGGYSGGAGGYSGGAGGYSGEAGGYKGSELSPRDGFPIKDPLGGATTTTGGTGSPKVLGRRSPASGKKHEVNEQFDDSDGNGSRAGSGGKRQTSAASDKKGSNSASRSRTTPSPFLPREVCFSPKDVAALQVKGYLSKGVDDEGRLIVEDQDGKLFVLLKNGNVVPAETVGITADHVTPLSAKVLTKLAKRHEEEEKMSRLSHPPRTSTASSAPEIWYGGNEASPTISISSKASRPHSTAPDVTRYASPGGIRFDHFDGEPESNLKEGVVGEGMNDNLGTTSRKASKQSSASHHFIAEVARIRKESLASKRSQARRNKSLNASDIERFYELDDENRAIAEARAELVSNGPPRIRVEPSLTTGDYNVFLPSDADPSPDITLRAASAARMSVVSSSSTYSRTSRTPSAAKSRKLLSPGSSLTQASNIMRSITQKGKVKRKAPRGVPSANPLTHTGSEMEMLEQQARELYALDPVRYNDVIDDLLQMAAVQLNFGESQSEKPTATDRTASRAQTPKQMMQSGTGTASTHTNLSYSRSLRDGNANARWKEDDDSPFERPFLPHPSETQGKEGGSGLAPLTTIDSTDSRGDSRKQSMSGYRDENRRSVPLREVTLSEEVNGGRYSSELPRVDEHALFLPDIEASRKRQLSRRDRKKVSIRDYPEMDDGSENGGASTVNYEGIPSIQRSTDSNGFRHSPLSPYSTEMSESPLEDNNQKLLGRRDSSKRFSELYPTMKPVISHMVQALQTKNPEPTAYRGLALNHGPKTEKPYKISKVTIDSSGHSRRNIEDGRDEINHIMFEQMKAKLLLRSILAQMRSLWNGNLAEKDRDLRAAMEKQYHDAQEAAWQLSRHRVINLNKLISIVDRKTKRVEGWIPCYNDDNVIVDSLGNRFSGVQRSVHRAMHLARHHRLLPIRLIRRNVQEKWNQHLLFGYTKRVVTLDEINEHIGIIRGRPETYKDMRTPGQRLRYCRRLQHSAAFQHSSVMFSPKSRLEVDLPFARQLPF